MARVGLHNVVAAAGQFPDPFTAYVNEVDAASGFEEAFPPFVDEGGCGDRSC